MSRVLAILLSLAVLSGFDAWSTQTTGASKTQVPAANQPSGVPEDFAIGLEDVLQITVWKEPELSTKVTVRPDGKISLPLIDEIQAKGLTTRQLQGGITERLKDFVESPVVSVIVVEIHSQAVHLLGQVSKPGIYTFGAPITVLEVLARAGGFTEEAKKKSIQVVRKEGGKTLQYRLNYKDFLGGKNLQNNIILRNGDIIIVP